MAVKKENAPQTSKEDKIKYNDFPLTKTNFILMAICGALIVLGFLLILGSPNQLDHFNAEIFSTRRIAVGPSLAFLGFLGMAFAIIYKKKEK